ncbi:hypothetical protein ACLKA6_012017 [Drosophila palustris]
MDQEPSPKIHPTDKLFLNSSINDISPSDPNCSSQLTQNHTLGDSKVNYHDFRYNIEMQNIRNRDGLGPSIAMNMDRFTARQVGRRNTLTSSNMMEDVITGRCDDLDFTDTLRMPPHKVQKHPPHVAMETSMGLSPQTEN